MTSVLMVSTLDRVRDEVATGWPIYMVEEQPTADVIDAHGRVAVVAGDGYDREIVDDELLDVMLGGLVEVVAERTDGSREFALSAWEWLTAHGVETAVVEVGWPYVSVADHTEAGLFVAELAYVGACRDAIEQWLAGPDVETENDDDAGDADDVDHAGDVGDVGDVGDNPYAYDDLQLPSAFWAARPELWHVRQAAHHAGLPADAVLGHVLARLSGLTPNYICPNPGGSLNVLIGVCGPSGAGKSSAQKLARRLLPGPALDLRDEYRLEVDGWPLGSGEGVAEVFMGEVEAAPDDDGGRKRPAKTERRQVRRQALLVGDEASVIAEMSQRRGATLTSVLRSAWTGDSLGQTNASKETRRLIAAGEYRLSVAVNVPPPAAAALLSSDEVAAGTPQRILWLSAVDPTIPDDAPVDPGPLQWTRPMPPRIAGRPVIMDLASMISAELRRNRLARARGEDGGDAIDAHRDYSALKVACLLAILAGRLSVAVDDWSLANVVMETSGSVRDGARAEIARAAGVAARAADDRHVDREVRASVRAAETAEERALTSMARSIAVRAHKLGVTITARDASRATKSSHRALVSIDDACELAIAKGWLVVDGEGWRPGASRPS